MVPLVVLLQRCIALFWLPAKLTNGTNDAYHFWIASLFAPSALDRITLFLIALIATNWNVFQLLSFFNSLLLSFVLYPLPIIGNAFADFANEGIPKLFFSEKAGMFWFVTCATDWFSFNLEA
jgi:hypothetical protein